MPEIYFYKLYLFSSNKKDENDYIELTQEEGQKLVMLLASDSEKRFVLINDDLINTAAIEQLVKCKSRIYDQKEFKNIDEVRELTPEEEEIQKLFDKFKGRKLLK